MEGVFGDVLAGGRWSDVVEEEKRRQKKQNKSNTAQSACSTAGQMKGAQVHHRWKKKEVFGGTRNSSKQARGPRHTASYKVAISGACCQSICNPNPTLLPFTGCLVSPVRWTTGGGGSLVDHSNILPLHHLHPFIYSCCSFHMPLESSSEQRVKLLV